MWETWNGYRVFLLIQLRRKLDVSSVAIILVNKEVKVSSSLGHKMNGTERAVTDKGSLDFIVCLQLI